MFTFFNILGWVIIGIGILVFIMGVDEEDCGKSFITPGFGILIIMLGIGVNHTKYLTSEWKSEFVRNNEVRLYKIMSDDGYYTDHPIYINRFDITEDDVKELTIIEETPIGKCVSFSFRKNSITKLTGKSQPRQKVNRALVPNGIEISEIKQFVRYDKRNKSKWIIVAETDKPNPDIITFDKKTRRILKEHDLLLSY